MSENTDTRTPEQQAPRKADAAASAHKAPKAPKEPKPPKEPWTAPERAVEATSIMREYAEAGDKKVLAFFVSEAIACRQRGKEVRDSLSNEEGPGPGADLPDAERSSDA